MEFNSRIEYRKILMVFERRDVIFGIRSLRINESFICFNVDFRYFEWSYCGKMGMRRFFFNRFRNEIVN